MGGPGCSFSSDYFRASWYKLDMGMDENTNDPNEYGYGTNLLPCMCLLFVMR